MSDSIIDQAVEQIIDLREERARGLWWAKSKHEAMKLFDILRHITIRSSADEDHYVDEQSTSFAVVHESQPVIAVALTAQMNEIKIASDSHRDGGEFEFNRNVYFRPEEDNQAINYLVRLLAGIQLPAEPLNYEGWSNIDAQLKLLEAVATKYGVKVEGGRVKIQKYIGLAVTKHGKVCFWGYQWDEVHLFDDLAKLLIVIAEAVAKAEREKYKGD